MVICSARTYANTTGGSIMPDIRPISDLRMNFAEITETLQESGEPIFLTKNGYGSIVVLSIDAYEELRRKAQENNKTP